MYAAKIAMQMVSNGNNDLILSMGDSQRLRCQLHILILSRAPIYHSLGPTKVRPAGNLGDLDAREWVIA